MCNGATVQQATEREPDESHSNNVIIIDTQAQVHGRFCIAGRPTDCTRPPLKTHSAHGHTTIKYNIRGINHCKYSLLVPCL